jgi:uncharacterized protein (DUF2236 family)
VLNAAAASDAEVAREESPRIPVGSVSWRVFKNPVAAFVGGVAAVFLELAEPRVRTGVWDHTMFRTDPLSRMKRTGEATMVTVYGSRAEATKLIFRICRMHERISGVTPDGQPYRASDPELLDWVHVTASYGFLEAYSAFVRPLTPAEKDQFYAAGIEVASLYGAVGAPHSEAERAAQFEAMLPLLEPSPIIFEFLDILEKTRILPFPLNFLQKTLIRASIDILPGEVRDRLALGADFDLSDRGRSLVSWLGRRTDGLSAPRPTRPGSKRRNRGPTQAVAKS